MEKSLPKRKSLILERLYLVEEYFDSRKIILPEQVTLQVITSRDLEKVLNKTQRLARQ